MASVIVARASLEIIVGSSLIVEAVLVVEAALLPTRFPRVGIKLPVKKS
jgi:hypothetical protein